MRIPFQDMYFSSINQEDPITPYLLFNNYQNRLDSYFTVKLGLHLQLLHE